MGVYDRQIALALRLIEAKGQKVTWRQPGAPTGTDANPGPSGPPTEFLNVPILFLPSKGQSNLAAFFSAMAESEVPTGGVRGLMAAVSFTPSLMDTVLRGSEVLSLMRDTGIDQLAPNGEVILWYLRFSR